MNQNITKLVTMYNHHFTIDQNNIVTQFSFSLYRRFIDYFVRPFQSRYGVMLQGFVPLETYGLIVIQELKLDGELRTTEVDIGSLSVNQYEVNSLMHQLCRLKQPNQDTVEMMILSESVSWANRMRGNPFDKKAEGILLRKIKEELVVNRPLIEGLSAQESITKRIQLCLLRQQFKKLD